MKAPIQKGRLRREATLIVSVRLPASVYDRYCQQANHSGYSVRSVLRRVLTKHAPRVTY